MQVTGNNLIHPERNILSIRISANGFSFLVSDSIRNNIICHAERQLSTDYSYLINLKQAFAENDFLETGPYEKVHVLIVNQHYTFVPLELFDENQKDIIFDYNISRADNEIVHSNILVNNSSAVLFSIDKDVYEFLKKRFPDMVMYSHISVLTECFSLKSRSVRLKQMFAYLRPGYVDVFCFDRGAISLVNSFKAGSATDFSYYLLLVWKQLGMNQLNDELYIAGNSDIRKELIGMLANFVKKLTDLPNSELNDSSESLVKALPYDFRLLLMKEKV